MAHLYPNPSSPYSAPGPRVYRPARHHVHMLALLLLPVDQPFDVPQSIIMRRDAQSAVHLFQRQVGIGLVQRFNGTIEDGRRIDSLGARVGHAASQ